MMLELRKSISDGVIRVHVGSQSRHFIAVDPLVIFLSYFVGVSVVVVVVVVIAVVGVIVVGIVVVVVVVVAIVIIVLLIIIKAYGAKDGFAADRRKRHECEIDLIRGVLDYGVNSSVSARLGNIP
jgi:hypothetical protein